MDIMDTQYYRILNPLEEPQGQILSSSRKSTFRQEVLAYWNHSNHIYEFAKKTGLQIKNAIRVAENAPAFIDELNEFFKSSETQYELLLMAVNDPVEFVSKDELYEFTGKYLTEINRTGLYYDWGNDYYLWEFVWEIVRYYKYPKMPSRMESLFLFDSLENAKDFKTRYRDANYQIANLNLIEGTLKSFDMNWFSTVPSDIPISEAENYARHYWEQKRTDNFIVEVLFQGKYIWK